MPSQSSPLARVVEAVHGRREVSPDPEYQTGLAMSLRAAYGPTGLAELYARFAVGDGPFDAMMRRTIFKAACHQCGPGLEVGSGVGFRHLDSFVIGAGVFIGAGAYLQGRHDGACTIGDHVWIGPQAYFDARELTLEDHVGWGPGARVLGSEHTGLPADVPIIATGLEIRPVIVGAWADIGTNAVLLPGVTIGKGAIVGAGAVVTHDVPPFAIVAGVPARFLRWRDDSEALRNGAPPAEFDP